MRRLKDLTIHEISLVKRAANKRKFLITKSHGARMPTPELEKIRDSLLSVPEPVLKAVDAVAKGTFAKDDSTMTLTDDQQARLKAAGRMLQPVIQDVPMDAITQMLAAIGATGTDALMDSDLAQDVDADEAVDTADTDAAEDVAQDVDAADLGAAAAEDAAGPAAQAAAMVDADTPATADVTVPGKMKKEDGDKRMACMKAALEKSKAVYAQMMKDAGFDEDEEGTPTPAPGAGVMKNQEAVAKSHQDELAALKKKHMEAVAKSCDLQLKLDKQEMVQKAAELPHLGAADAMVQFLLNNKQKDPEGFADNFKIMKSWNDTMNSNDIFAEVGSAQAEAGHGDAETRINQMVQSLVQKSGNLSPQQAYTQVVTQTPEGQAAYKEYMATSFSVKGK